MFVTNNDFVTDKPVLATFPRPRQLGKLFIHLRIELDVQDRSLRNCRPPGQYSTHMQKISDIES